MSTCSEQVKEFFSKLQICKYFLKSKISGCFTVIILAPPPHCGTPWVDIFNVNCSGDVDESYMNMLSGVMDGGDAGSGNGASDADGAVGQDYLRDVSYWKGKNPFG